MEENNVTKAECAKKLRELANQYNEELNAVTPNENLLDSIEEQAKETQGKAKAARKAEVYAQFDQAANPMLEAARVGEFDYDGYGFDKETDEMVVMPRTAIATHCNHAFENSAHEILRLRYFIVSLMPKVAYSN